MDTRLFIILILIGVMLLIGLVLYLVKDRRRSGGDEASKSQPDPGSSTRMGDSSGRGGPTWSDSTPTHPPTKSSSHGIESYTMEKEAALDTPPVDAVRLGASAPQTVRPGDEFTARFVAYTPEDEEQVRDMLQTLSPGSATHLDLKTCRWQRGTRVMVRLSSRHLEIDEPEQTFVWEGEHVLLDFDVYVPDDATPRTTVLKYTVAIDGITVARLRLDLEITPESTTTARVTNTAEPARSAFASYASKDRLRVLDRVAAVRIAADLDIFLDCLSLKPGDQWKDELQKEIEARDLFLLFWSDDAKESPWVEWEWQMALAQKGLDGIQLHPLDLVNEAPPPDELKALHFGDAYMLARKAQEGRS